ncbi:hypothetical protein [Komagataeibacter oboediens]|uniref:hypothetical protein n=1 Tax=Komagataeibacter oboediens TaxID=65958 RepID=UPI00200C8351|nr:hypothetical protein [Komagataeibacter oboediens]MCK9818998.1 hypothetical protein [Komagataeibacter oboediens]
MKYNGFSSVLTILRGALRHGTLIIAIGATVALPAAQVWARPWGPRWGPPPRHRVWRRPPPPPPYYVPPPMRMGRFYGPPPPPPPPMMPPPPVW